MKIQDIIQENKYIVSYDLRGDDRDDDYKKLEKELVNEYDAKHLLDSVWGLSSDLTYKQLYRRIKRFTKVKDRLIVIRAVGGRGTGLYNKLSSV